MQIGKSPLHIMWLNLLPISHQIEKTHQSEMESDDNTAYK